MGEEEGATCGSRVREGEKKEKVQGRKKRNRLDALRARQKWEGP